MARFNATGKTVAVRAATGNEQFYTIAPGTYVASVVEIKDGEPFQAPVKNYPNPATSDGKWTMHKITPVFEVLNANRTKIERQDMTIGIFDEDGLPFSPNPKGNAVFEGWYNPGTSPRGGSLGAAGLLKAVGVMQVNGGEATFEGDTADIHGALVNISTGVGAYTKDKSAFFGPDEFAALITKLNGGTLPAFDQYHVLLKAYNEQNNKLGTDGELKMKNVVMDVFPLTEAQIVAGNYHQDVTGAVYAAPGSSAPATTSAPTATPTATGGKKKW